MAAKPLALTMGDPAGCGPQITASAWQALKTTDTAPFALIADPATLTGLCPTEIITDIKDAAHIFTNALPILSLSQALPHPPVPGHPDAAFAPGIIESIEIATRLALAGDASAMITNPISKAVLYSAGFQHPGHTEFLAAQCSEATKQPITPVMMLVGGGLRVALASIHIPLMQVGAYLSTEHLVAIGRITASALRRDFGITAPRLAFTGLNPHAGEEGMIGREEIDIINPAATVLRGEGIQISDARPGDTVFLEALNDRYDAVIAMTHDQGLIPVKTLDMWGGVNTTLGLPVIRTSPDHGTAYEAAKSAGCRPDSLLAALKLAGDMAENRTRNTHV